LESRDCHEKKSVAQPIAEIKSETIKNNSDERRYQILNPEDNLNEQRSTGVVRCTMTISGGVLNLSASGAFIYGLLPDKF